MNLSTQFMWHFNNFCERLRSPSTIRYGIFTGQRVQMVVAAVCLLSTNYSLAQPWTFISLKYNVCIVSFGGTSRVETRASPPLPISLAFNSLSWILCVVHVNFIASGHSRCLQWSFFFFITIHATAFVQMWLLRTQLRAHRITRVIRNNSSSTHWSPACRSVAASQNKNHQYVRCEFPSLCWVSEPHAHTHSSSDEYTSVPDARMWLIDIN